MKFKQYLSAIFSKNVVNSIYFWIILCFVIRLFGITNPPIDIHGWRQTTGLMVARNFMEIDNDIRYPRVDDNKGETGIIGMEFPSQNYIHYIVASIFGWQHWYGRFINLIISSIGILFFYRLLKLFLNHNIALYASIAFLFSIWFIFSRKNMPDTYCISLIFIALYYGVLYLIKNRWYYYCYME